MRYYLTFSRDKISVYFSRLSSKSKSPDFSNVLACQPDIELSETKFVSALDRVSIIRLDKVRKTVNTLTKVPGIMIPEDITEWGMKAGLQMGFYTI